MTRHRYRLIYDGQCPVCAAGAARAEVDTALGELRCIDARCDRQVLRELQDTGLNIDQGRE